MESSGDNMNSKFTAIYIDSWVSADSYYHHTLTKMKRIEQRDGETVADMLERENIKDSTIFLFYGHPLMQGTDAIQLAATWIND